jgi:protein involved in polysaccharide export with SLBB domain
VDAQRRAGDASLKPADRTRAQGDVATLRRRLEQGDFQPGDRFFMTVIADSVRRGEVTVREGPEIEFGALPPLSLAGVLRSELQSAIHRHLSRYFRSPEVRVQHMLRLTVSGAVGRPGSHAVAPDALIADVVTVVAGGFAPGAKMDRITVLRGNREIVSRKDYQRAVQSGRTVESLGLRAGDEIRVDMREQRRNWAQIATVGAFAISILISLLALIRSSYAD